MASQRYLYSDILRRSGSPTMFIQGMTGEVESRIMEKDVGSSPNIFAQLKIKKEKIEKEDFSRDRHEDASISTFLDEGQSFVKNDCSELFKDRYDIKVENKNAQTRNDNTNTTQGTATSETKGNTKSNAEVGEEVAEVGASRNKSKLIQFISDVRKSNASEWVERLSAQEDHLHNKRKTHEIYDEEHLIINDPRREVRRIPPANRPLNYEAQVHWHQAKEREIKTNDKLGYPPYRNNTNASEPDPPTFPGMKMPSNDRLVDQGIGCTLGKRTTRQIDGDSTLFSSIDPRNHTFPMVLRDEQRTRYFPEDNTCKSLQDELVHKAWFHPTIPEHYFKGCSKVLKGVSVDDTGSSNPFDTFKRHLLHQEGSYWPYFDRSAQKDAVYENQRIAFLTTDLQGVERNNQNNEYPFITEQQSISRASLDEYCKYVQVPNMLIPTPKIPEVLTNGIDCHSLISLPHNHGHPFSVREKDSFFYPCHKKGQRGIRYEVMPAKERWLATRNESQTVNPFQNALQFRENQPLAQFLNEAGSRIIHVNDFGCDDKSNKEKKEMSKDGTRHKTSKRQSSLEGILQAEIQRLNDGNRRKHALHAKDELFSPSQDYKNTKLLDRKTSEVKAKAWQAKEIEATTSKELLESRTCDSTKEVITKMLKDEDIGKSAKRMTDVSQVTEETKTFKDPKNSESQLTNSLEQVKPNQTESSLKRITCCVCNKTFNRTSNLYTHMRTHSANKPHACEFCGKRFHQKADLRIHRYIHTGEKPHKCSKCGRGFKQLTHLKYHMRTHSDVRMYKCPYCEKGFNQKSNLQAHIFGHTGQRPHKCETCGKGFTLASTLNTHKRTHLPNKPFKCEFCDRAFYQKNALKMHYVSTHPYSSGACLV